MARIKLGSTPEQLEQEKAQRLRDQEAEVQRQNQLQDKKLRQLILKEKRNKFIIVLITIIITLALLVFGTYNTFFKQPLEEKDVVKVVRSTITNFPVSGLDGFIRNNFEIWFKDYASFNRDGNKGISYVEPDLNTFSIDNVVQVTNNLARVYFSIDITTKHTDLKSDDGTTTEGLKKITRYNFYIPIEYRYYYNEQGKATKAGYIPVAPMSFYVLVQADSNKVTQDNPNMIFKSEQYDDKTKESAKIKVDKIFNDLYSGRDTSQDFLSFLPFNVDLNATYVGLDSFKFFKEPNAFGFNAIVQYTIKTADGFNYQNQHYLSVVKNGNTWMINGIQ
jgi:hypothetical protein